jgi:hypothetical protein
MYVPEDLYGAEYYADLRRFRTEALEASPHHGRQLHIGRLSVGTIYAQWWGVYDNQVLLEDGGLHWGHRYFGLGPPTVLTIYGTVEQPGQRFEMSIDHSGAEWIQCYPERLATGGAQQAIAHHAADRELHKQGKTGADKLSRARLYVEFSRGAGGAHVRG